MTSSSSFVSWCSLTSGGMKHCFTQKQFSFLMKGSSWCHHVDVTVTWWWCCPTVQEKTVKSIIPFRASISPSAPPSGSRGQGKLLLSCSHSEGVYMLTNLQLSRPLSHLYWHTVAITLLDWPFFHKHLPFFSLLSDLWCHFSPAQLSVSSHQCVFCF